MNQPNPQSKNQTLRSLDVVLSCPDLTNEGLRTQFLEQLASFSASECVSRLLILHQGSVPQLLAPLDVMKRLEFIQVDSWFSGLAMTRILETATKNILLLMPTSDQLEIEEAGLEEFLAVALATEAGLVYSDFRIIRHREVTEHLLCDYQLGSMRETFDFGGMVLIAREVALEALRRHGEISPELRWAGFYDLRLKLSTDSLIQRIPQPLYIKRRPLSGFANQPDTWHPSDEAGPDAEDQRMEIAQIAAEHLRRIGAILEPVVSTPPRPDRDYPVTASIIIPVRNREQTIGEALRSALGQKTSFAYNVIVVDDHSTDRTTAIIEQLAREHQNIVHLTPERTDFAVGGLWNLAISSAECGLFAVQLDSDDVYADPFVLQKIVDKFWDAPASGGVKRPQVPRYGLVIGSFSQVDFKLEDIPDKFVSHPEIAGDNAGNNALRVDGLGAPRAFYVPLLSQLGFPNVSFGEDYAVCLRLSRNYEIGRIFERLYLARSWEGNTKRSLPLGTIKSVDFRDLMPPGTKDARAFLGNLAPVIRPLRNASKNHYNHYKDWLRTMEIRERINLNRKRIFERVNAESSAGEPVFAAQREIAGSVS
jgi:glycosyltransferase involved in cell wall biosynthesis